MIRAKFKLIFSDHIREIHLLVSIAICLKSYAICMLSFATDVTGMATLKTWTLIKMGYNTKVFIVTHWPWNLWLGLLKSSMNLVKYMKINYHMGFVLFFFCFVIIAIIEGNEPKEPDKDELPISKSSFIRVLASELSNKMKEKGVNLNTKDNVEYWEKVFRVWLGRFFFSFSKHLIFSRGWGWVTWSLNLGTFMKFLGLHC